MSGIEPILDQGQPVRILAALFQNNAVPHALLFTGIDGVGKKNCATAFAMLCNCFERRNNINNKDGSNCSILSAADLINPCGCCISCRKIKAGSHPDIIQIKPIGNSIRIEQIRNLEGTIEMKPYEAGVRVVIIVNAQLMTPAASNALLKSLEEPPARTIFILTATQISDLIPTIISRCQHIRFNPISLKNITRMLVEKLSLNQESAQIIASVANGSLFKALEMGRNNSLNWIKRRDWLLNAVAQNCFTCEGPNNISESYGLIFAIADKLSRNRNILFESLEMIKIWFRDLAVCKYSPNKVINIDMIENIQSVADKVSIESICIKIKAIHKAQKNIKANANIRITLDALLMRLAGV